MDCFAFNHKPQYKEISHREAPRHDSAGMSFRAALGISSWIVLHSTISRNIRRNLVAKLLDMTVRVCHSELREESHHGLFCIQP